MIRIPNGCRPVALLAAMAAGLGATLAPTTALAGPAADPAASKAAAVKSATDKSAADKTAAPSAEAQARAAARLAALRLTDRLIVRYAGTQTSAVDDEDGKAYPAALAVEPQKMAAHAAVAARVAGAHGLSARLMRQTALGSHVYKLDRMLAPADLQRVMADLKAADPAIERVDPDRRATATWTPDDTYFNDQWPLFAPAGGIRARTAWNIARGRGVTVAVIDTGIRPHADLRGQVYAGYDFISDADTANDGDARDDDPSDPGDAVAAGECGPGSDPSNSSWHGTHVAGTIAARTDNAMGIAGVAPRAKILPLRALGKCGGYESDISDAIVWASGGSVPDVPRNRHRAKVLNLSLGGDGVCGTTYQSAIDTARARGSIVVVAAGNENKDASQTSPASCSGPIVVGAMSRFAQRAGYSNFGSVVTLSGPGGDQSLGEAEGVLSTLDSGTGAPAGDTYAYYQGTSMATPHVAGVVALMLSAKPRLSEAALKRALTRSARPPAAGCACGSGVLDAYGALYAIKTRAVRVIREADDHQTADTAQRVTRPAIVNADFADGVADDWYRVTIGNGKRLGAMLQIPDALSDFDLEVLDANGSQVALSELSEGYSDSVQYVNETGATATYYIHVYYYEGPAGAYTLKLFW